MASREVDRRRGARGGECREDALAILATARFGHGVQPGADKNESRLDRRRRGRSCHGCARSRFRGSTLTMAPSACDTSVGWW